MRVLSSPAFCASGCSENGLSTSAAGFDPNSDEFIDDSLEEHNHDYATPAHSEVTSDTLSVLVGLSPRAHDGNAAFGGECKPVLNKPGLDSFDFDDSLLRVLC